MGNEITTNWSPVIDGKEHSVQLRHNTFSGRREVLVDGKLMLERLKFLDDGDLIPVEVAGKAGEIEIIADVSAFRYVFRLDGESIPDDLSTGPQVKDVASVEVRIPRYEVKLDDKGESVVWYEVVVVMDGHEEKAVRLYRRFSEFSNLNDKIRSAFVDNHLLDNVPPFPPKHPKLLFDHTSPAFLDARREELETYIRRLVQVPRVVHNPDFLRFCSNR